MSWRRASWGSHLDSWRGLHTSASSRCHGLLDTNRHSQYIQRKLIGHDGATSLIFVHFFGLKSWYQTFPDNSCGCDPGQGVTHLSPEAASLFILEHKFLTVPPFNGLMSRFENLNLSHGALWLQCIAAATLYWLVPVMFSQLTSTMPTREESQSEPASVMKPSVPNN